MYKKAEKHHYATSTKARNISIIISVLTFVALMFYFVVLRGRPIGDPIYSNISLAIGSVFLISASYIIGPLARFFPKRFVSKLEYRKPLGVYGYLFAIVHIATSFFVFPESFATNAVALFFGIVALLIFTLVASTSIIEIDAHGFERWQKIQRTGYLAFILVILHFAFLDSGAFLGRQIGQITLAFAALVLLARLIALLMGQPKKKI